MIGRFRLSSLIFFGLALGLALFGYWTQTSVFEVTGDVSHRTQGKWLVISLVAGIAVAMIPYRFLLRRAYLVYAAALGLLALVPVIGVSRNFSRRWLELGGISVQPSELMKIAFILALARMLQHKSDFGRWRKLLPVAILLGAPVLLIFAQPDLSTAVLFVPTGLAMLYVAGAERRHVLRILLGGLIGAVLIFSFLLAPYQRERVLSTFMRSKLTESEQKREGFQLEQAIRSIGIGGLAGQGWGQGTQNRLNMLPYRHNDFIFAVIAEERGFLGALLLFGLILALMMAIFRTARLSRETGGRLLCVGTGTLFGCQSLVHVGVNIGLVPTTGMTLPFVSAGGTSLLTFSIAVALASSVARSREVSFAGSPLAEQLARLRALGATGPGPEPERPRPTALQAPRPMVESSPGRPTR
ncbi:MAG: rod shape-determining protein RodA [Planctomycetes bacterium]|nr:rod shape-determining protein RodA [Planctomycetota bacterium]